MGGEAATADADANFVDFDDDGVHSINGLDHDDDGDTDDHDVHSSRH